MPQFDNDGMFTLLEAFFVDRVATLLAPLEVRVLVVLHTLVANGAVVLVTKFLSLRGFWHSFPFALR